MFNKKNEATMKKTYINPAMVIVKLRARQQMLTGSATLGLGADGSANEAEGRYFDFDFDDEE